LAGHIVVGASVELKNQRLAGPQFSPLNQLHSYFNAAELDAVSVTKYIGFQVAKVSLHARRIQQQASLGLD
jgi:NAD/NADP transhydrogenase alpha subunit